MAALTRFLVVALMTSKDGSDMALDPLKCCKVLLISVALFRPVCASAAKFPKLLAVLTLNMLFSSQTL